MDATVLLCDSTICRLCSEENENGTILFATDENKENLSELVNKYLPIKVERDGKYPCTLCPGCTIQVEATKSFFDLIIEGQSKLRDFFAAQQETLRRQEKQKEQLENALKNQVGPSVQTYTMETGEKFLIQILSDDPLFPPDHEMTLRVEGLDKPKKKRGRPPKPLHIAEKEIVEEVKEEEPEFDADGKRKRRIKKPLRYSELIQGKELDKLLKEEGVFDDDEEASTDDGDFQTVKDILEATESNEIIGHMQGKDGENLGQLVVINKNNKIKPKLKPPVVKVKDKFECEFCGRAFLHLGRLEVHKSFHKNFKYQCGQEACSILFDAKIDLELHQSDTGHVGSTLIERIENYGQVELPQLHEDFPKKQSPAESEKLSEKLSCATCSKTFVSKHNLSAHINAVHEKNQEEIDAFLQPSPEKTYPCESCQKVFNHPSSLVYHREAEHNNGRKFVCNKCKKSFKHKQLLLKHQLVHTNDRPHVCKNCGASFKTRANLLNHMPTHTGEKKYYCSQCGQTFAHKTSLTLHVRWHNGQKPYECDVCMKTFSQKGNLAEHRRIHTGEKPYCCTFCGRRFTTSSQFKLHVKRHTGERPWKCEYCSKTFLHKDTWKCHMRRHRNERPFQCQQCLRGFTEQWALKKHERLHTGEKPYVCDICSKCFADSSNLTKHKKVHWNTKNRIKDKARIDNINIIKIGDADKDDEQILYLSYDETNPTESQGSSLINDQLFNSAGILRASEDMSLDMQLQQLVDDDGNPINLTTADGQQIKVVTTMSDDEQCIQGLLPDGTLVPINLTMQDGKPVAAELIAKDGLDIDKKPDDADILESGNILEENMQLLEDDDNTAIGNKLRLTDPNLEGKIQFLTEDGQNVCFITTYDIEDSTIGNQYIDMQ